MQFLLNNSRSLLLIPEDELNEMEELRYLLLPAESPVVEPLPGGKGWNLPPPRSGLRWKPKQSSHRQNKEYMRRKPAVSLNLHYHIYYPTYSTMSFLGFWLSIAQYPHNFHNDVRLRKDKIASPPTVFPNKGTTVGGLIEFLILRSPQGVIFGWGANPDKNPNRVVFRLKEENTVT